MKCGPGTRIGRLTLLSSACLLSACAPQTLAVLPSLPPPPADSVQPCEWPALPEPLTARALELWLLDDARADAACEARRQALVDAWPD
ncbi:MAG: hypothetical protein WCZ66_09120 [Sphingomonadaceae bacterium]